MIKITYGPKIDYTYCNSCTRCYEDCPMDIFGWDVEKKIPLVLYPFECALCCICEMICPELAIDVRFPLHTLMDFGIDPAHVTDRSMTNYPGSK
jgi:adenylylsulfate reductase subunit B